MKHLAIVCFLTCAYVFGQAVSQISGTATDPSGAAVPGVEIKLTQLETGVARTATSDGTGNYIVSNLPLGPYRLEASKMDRRRSRLFDGPGRVTRKGKVAGHRAK